MLAAVAAVAHPVPCLPAQAALESYLAGVQRSPTNEDAVYRAQQLLAALVQLGDI